MTGVHVMCLCLCLLVLYGCRFEVEISRKLPTPAALADALGNANQMWLISGSKVVLTAAHVDVIKAVWRTGLGLYIAGDNDPYFADANALLAGLGLPLMAGNFLGRAVLRPVSDYIEHEITTGIEGAYCSSVVTADCSCWIALPLELRKRCARLF